MRQSRLKRLNKVERTEETVEVINIGANRAERTFMSLCARTMYKNTHHDAQSTQRQPELFTHMV